METGLIVARALHLTAVVALLGGWVFSTWIADTRRSPAGQALSDAERRTLQTSVAWLALAIVSGAAWLALEAIAMSGLPIEDALGNDTLGVVLTQTRFGRVWLVRAILAAILVALLLAAGRVGPVLGRRLFLACTITAVALAASLASIGHASSERGGPGAVHWTADALHLLAASAWVGALMPLASMLGRARGAVDEHRLHEVVRATRRFSNVALASVGALALTGIVNAWFTVATVSALLSTHYGHLLLVKLGLFGLMLAFAAVNRATLTPTAADRSVAPHERIAALRRLRRNAMAEAGLGLAVLALVGALGLSMPAVNASQAMPAMHMH